MKKLLLTIVFVLIALTVHGVEHPCLNLTKETVRQIVADRDKIEILSSSVDDVLGYAEEALARPLCVPIPRDGGGGSTHEQHKQNYLDMYNCGLAFQISGDRRYAEKVKDILTEYSALYPTLSYHPIKMSSVPGRIFWQTLNESVWLFYTSMAYDYVYEYIPEHQRAQIEKNLFRPYAHFIMEGTADNRANLSTFNRTHNHATWATAAVGMIGLVMGDSLLVQKSLYGTDLDGKGGFVRQIDELFSPEGYFTEGAYYQRYSILPFITFAQCISSNTDVDLISYRDRLLPRSVGTLLQMSYQGKLFKFNDALEKDFSSNEFISAVDMAYASDRSQKGLLSIVKDYHGKVLISDAGYIVARDISNGEAAPFKTMSMILTDGSAGKDGGLAILRSPSEGSESTVLVKATSHGMGHGHYDKLSLNYFDNGSEILTDYGAARFVNVEAKNKGHYTRENTSYAMTTVAHNTVVVDGQSQSCGQLDKASLHAPEILNYSINDASRYFCAMDRDSYEGASLTRWVCYHNAPWLEYPLIIDIFTCSSDAPHQYDLMFHYSGHMTRLTSPHKRYLDSMHTLGDRDGYQHLWVEADGHGTEGTTTYTWMQQDRMYSISSATDNETEVYLLRTGANDPDFNLRSEPAYLIREKDKARHTFASCIETHGKYDVRMEQTSNLDASCTSVRITDDTDRAITIEYTFKQGHKLVVTADKTTGILTIN